MEVREGSGESEVLFHRPDGEPFPVAPQAPAVPPDAMAELVRRHRSSGVDPDAWTATPLWQGETLDLGLAIDMLRGLEEGSDGGKGGGEPDSRNAGSP